MITAQQSWSQQTIRQFIFGHSLIDHRPPAIAVPSDETTVPRWLYHMANAAGHDYRAGGKYGFLFQFAHAETYVYSQWGYSSGPMGVWDSDTQTFAEADINNILITAGNFLAGDLGINDPYYGDNSDHTPLSGLQDLLNWIPTEDNPTIFLYENWPEMSPLAGVHGSFPLSNSDNVIYHNFLNGTFHNWWINLHDAIITSHPSRNVKMIPVGPILSELINPTDGILGSMPITEFFEDPDPHGRSSLYFLASVITYMAILEEAPDPSFDVNSYPDSLIHPTIKTNFPTIISTVQTELDNFNFPDGSSRVYAGSSPPPPPTPSVVRIDNGGLFVNNSEGLILVDDNGNCYRIYIDNGTLSTESVDCPEE